MHVISNTTSGARRGRPATRTTLISEFDFIPATLRAQCRSLIQTFHAMHGYSCLPDMLWKAGLSGFIEKHRNLNEVLRKASTTRSARTANDLFVAIATEILSLEVLAREYASWSAVLPSAKILAVELLDQSTPSSRIWLMEHYLYPPRYNSPAAAIMVPSIPSSRATHSPSTHAPSRYGILDDLPETKSFRDIVLACRAENPVRQSRSEPILATHESSDR